MSDIGKGTVRLRISNADYSCDECSVTRKLNYGWKTATIKSRGNSLPLSEADVVEIYFENDSIQSKRIDGYVTSITENRKGKNIEYDYEVYGREAFVNYRLFKPTQRNTLATSFITDMMTSIGYPDPIFTSELNNVTITLDSVNDDYVHNHLRNLADKYTINYYYDNDLQLHAFYNSPNTLSTTLTYSAFNRDKVTDITNVYNRIALRTNDMSINDSKLEYLTESANDTTKWKFKKIKWNGPYVNFDAWFPSTPRLGDAIEESCTRKALFISPPMEDRGIYAIQANGITITPGEATPDNGWRMKMYVICDLGALYDPSTLNNISCNIYVDNGPNNLTYTVENHLFEQNVNYPPYHINALASYPFNQSHQHYYSFSSPKYNENTWNTISFNVSNMTALGKLDYARYLGFEILCEVDPTNVASTITVYIDNLHITTNASTIFTNIDSANLYGIRDYKPDNNGYIIARTQEEFAKQCNIILKYAPEQSLKSLQFPGSINLEVGTAVTLTFDDYTKRYRIEEITDSYTNGQWIQDISVSSSPIVIPKSKISDKIRAIDNKLRDIQTYGMSSNNTQVGVNLNDITATNIDSRNINFTNMSCDGTINFNFAAPSYSRESLLDAIYKWNVNDWVPEGFNDINNVLYFRDTITNNYVRQFPIIIMDGTVPSPAIVWDQAFINKKDITAGGFIGSNQGALGLGHGLYYSTEKPHIWLTHASISDYWATLDIKYWDSSGPETVEQITIGGTLYPSHVINWGYEKYAPVRVGKIVASPDYPHRNNYIEMSHDGTNANITSSNGNLTITATDGTVVFGSSINVKLSGITIDVDKNWGTHSVSNMGTLQVKAINAVNPTGLTFLTHIQPSSDGGADNGLSGYKWNRVYARTLITGNVWANTILNSTGNLGEISLGSLAVYSIRNLGGSGVTISNSWIPSADVTYDCGWAGQKWNRGYFATLITGNIWCSNIKDATGGSNTINIGNLSVGTINASKYKGMPNGTSLSKVTIDIDLNMGGKGIGGVGTLACDKIECNTIDTNLIGSEIVNAVYGDFTTINATTYLNLPPLSGITITSDLNMQGYNIGNVTTIACSNLESNTIDTNLIGAETVNAVYGQITTINATTYQNLKLSAVSIDTNLNMNNKGIGGIGTIASDKVETNIVDTNLIGTETINAVYADLTTCSAATYLNIPSAKVSSLSIDTHLNMQGYGIGGVGTLGCDKVECDTIDTNLLGAVTVNSAYADIGTATIDVINAATINASTIVGLSLPQKGSGSTGEDGSGYVSFDSAFAYTPIVVATPTSGTMVSLVITGVSSSGFSVLAQQYSEHKHLVLQNSDTSAWNPTISGESLHTHSIEVTIDTAGDTLSVSGTTDLANVDHWHGSGSLTTGSGSPHSHSISAFTIDSAGGEVSVNGTIGYTDVDHWHGSGSLSTGGGSNHSHGILSFALSNGGGSSSVSGSTDSYNVDHWHGSGNLSTGGGTAHSHETSSLSVASYNSTISLSGTSDSTNTDHWHGSGSLSTGGGTSHSHSYSHTHGMSGVVANTGNTSSHTHTYYVPNYWSTDSQSSTTTGNESSHTHSVGGNTGSVTAGSGNGAITHTHTLSSGKANISHSHTITGSLSNESSHTHGIGGNTGSVTSGSGTVNHSHTLSNVTVNTAHNHTLSSFLLYNESSHTHGIGGNTGSVTFGSGTVNHTHSISSVNVNTSHTHTVSSTTIENESEHTHGIGGNTGSVTEGSGTVNHSHTLNSVTVNTSHNHTISGANTGVPTSHTHTIPDYKTRAVDGYDTSGNLVNIGAVLLPSSDGSSATALYTKPSTTSIKGVAISFNWIAM